jgi:hypothetical protein
VFEGVTCDDCGETVPVSRTCKCGAWEPRDDEHVARRRAAIADVRGLLDRPIRPTTPIEFGAVIDALSPWIGALFEGLNALGEHGADPTGVRAEVEALTALRAQVAATSRRRPWLALWDPLAALLDELRDLAAAEIDAATAPYTEAAQRFEAIGQAHLDEAARQIRLVNVRLDWWGLDGTIRLPDSVIAAASAAYDTTGAANLLDLDRRGMRLYERITSSPAGPTGIGVGLLIDLGLVDRALDEERVYRVASLVYERLNPHRVALATLLDDPAWRSDLLNARRVFYESQLTAETLLRELAGNRRLEAAAVLWLGAQLIERVSSTLLGLVLATDPATKVKRTAPYDKVHAAARAAGLHDALLGFDDRVRNADAHTDFDVGPDYVVLGRNRTKPEKVGDDEIVDIVLASLESCAAIVAAIDCVINEEGHPAGQDRLADLPTSDMLSILLAASGVSPGQLEFKRDRLEVSGAAHGDLGINPLSVVAILTPYIPADVRRLVLRMKRRGGTVVADVVLEPLRRFQSSEGMAKNVDFVEFLGRASLNGKPVFSRRHVRFMMAHYVHELLEAPLAEVEQAGPLLAAAGRRLKDHELAEALDAFVLMKRARAGGPPVSSATVRTYNRLAEYIGRPPGAWNDGSGPKLTAA